MVRKRLDFNWAILGCSVYPKLRILSNLNFSSWSLKKRTSRLCPYRENTWKWHKVCLNWSSDDRKLNRRSGTATRVAWVPWETFYISISFFHFRNLPPKSRFLIVFLPKFLYFDFHKIHLSLLSYLSYRLFSQVVPVRKSIDLAARIFLT